jgi:hypothetical protein
VITVTAAIIWDSVLQIKWFCYLLHTSRRLIIAVNILISERNSYLVYFYEKQLAVGGSGERAKWFALIPLINETALISVTARDQLLERWEVRVCRLSRRTWSDKIGCPSARFPNPLVHSNRKLCADNGVVTEWVTSGGNCTSSVGSHRLSRVLTYANLK